MPERVDQQWWQSGVFYQIYPRSFMDSNGDGVGDIQGVIERLDHLEWLGVDAVWLNPTTPSPNEDWGYDVSDYRGVEPELGTLDQLEELIKLADERGIRILLDLVPNHTSSTHPWFIDAASLRDARHRDWYVWADPAPDGGPPNNWVSVFGGEPAWEFHEPTGQYYLHNFLATQPDLNWRNEEVKAEFRDILRFWFDKGIAGFRIDVAHALVNDDQLRDNPAATDKDPLQVQRIGQQQVYNMNRPETHDILREWRELSDGYESPRLLVGETYVYEYEQLAAFYGQSLDELNLAFNFPFIFSPFGAGDLKEAVEKTLQVLPQHATPVWTASNHDTSRFPTRWCEGNDDLVRCTLMMLLTLPGATFLYYGDEIGMTDVPVDYEQLQDPVGKRRWPDGKGRDPMRTPMQWTAEATGGFTTGTETWLPVGDAGQRNVQAQKEDPLSILHLCRDLIALRKRTPDLATGDYRTVSCSDDCWVWERGDSTVVALNLGENPAPLEITGTTLLRTHPGEDGDVLEPYRGIVMTTAQGPPGDPA